MTSGGAFFVTGSQGFQHPDILKQIVNEGHEIGNHSFTHKDLSNMSSLRFKFEVNATQKLIKDVTGYSTTLLRPPYTTDVDYNKKQLSAVKTAQDMGYLFVGNYIDSRDWEGKSSEEIVDTVLKELPNGNIILLHDGGGDRSETVAALPQIIKQLQSEGYSFVSISELLDLDQDDLMPPVEKNSSFGSIIESFASLGPLLATLFKLIFLTSFVVVLIRAVLFIYLSYKQKQTHTSIITEDYKPFVSVILPVYNEEKVIENTVSTILASNYTNYEIVIIDDGSTDRTRSILESNFNHLDHVHFISKENEGKAASLNRGIQEAQGDIIITMDADTEINEEAISYLIRHFQDPMVSAVSGNVKVGNKRKILSLWQHIEYVTSFNLEKRALQMINSITVVPGALGAWRKEDIEKVNLFEEETLAEDTDLTIKIIRTGKRIIFEEKAIGYTEVPTKLKDLTKQRLRWYFGILQSLWKHKDALFQRKYKGLAFVGIPNMMFQITFQLLVPIIDILLIIALLTQTYSLLIYILIFIAIDTFISLYAFKLERERLSPLRWIIIQRFAYRIFFAYITWKVVIKAIQGVSVKWGKLDRIGKKSY